ncbi:MAG: Crp/Fnr family transcriptional regulator [Planctomycetota bacterium]|jgi:signal-transduction protein with cAMP-binding, CBS, and nucleotidyltransferase domain
MSSGTERRGIPESKGIHREGTPAGQVAQLLESTKWADDFSAKEVDALSRWFVAYNVEKGAVIVREGERQAFMCLLVKGKASVTKKGSVPGSRLIQTIGIGKTLGEMSLIDGEPRSASVRAAEPTTLLAMSKQDFDKFCDQMPRLALKFVLKIAKLTSQRLRRTSGRLVDYLES